mmetsp:Transcript_17342/g.30525  ORF Transcript_17342/g.30525 Transcript_17342/m.30525 type:complete len:331 (-) Transcript_17342:1527-2519(-)
MTKQKKKKSKSSLTQQRHHQQTQTPVQSTSSPDSNRKKRRIRSQSEEDGQNNNDIIVSASIVPHVIQWLEKRKHKIPDALLKSDNDGAALASLTDIPRVLSLVPSLRERERRALVRHIEKCINNNGSGGNSDTKIELEGSDGEYDIHDHQGELNIIQGNSTSWPPNNVQFSNNYKWDPSVPNEIKDKYSPPNNEIRQRAPRLSNRVYFKRIADPNHPAHGEFGLYCALPHAPPGSWLMDYVGYVTLGEDQDKQSDYVSDFGEKSDLACDANSYGNEARFLNDFRNTGKHPNVEFTIRRDENGELRQGVYVKLKKDAKEEGFDGVNGMRSC